MRPSPTKDLAKKLGVKLRQARKLKAAAQGKSSGGGHVTAAAKARIEHIEAITKQQQKLRSVAGSLKFTPKLGIAAAVERMRAYEHQCAKELEAARDHGDADVVQAAHKSWLSAVEQLRKAENDAPSVDLANKDQISTGEVEEVWTRAILVFRKTLEAAAQRISINPTIANTDRVRLKELILDEHTRALQALEKVEWGDDGKKKK